MHVAPPLAERTLLHILRRGLERHPDAPAIADESLDLTYRQLWERASRVAGGLRAAGVREGDTVLSMLESSADCFVLLVATSFLGAPLVPVNLAWNDTYLSHAVAKTECKVAVVDDHLVDTLEHAAGESVRTLIVRQPDTRDATPAPDTPPALTWAGLLGSDPVEPVEVGPGTVLAIIFTSGTTGKSKGVKTTHAQAFTMCFYSPHQPERGAQARWYVPAPMFHALGLFGGTLAPLIVGGSAYVATKFSPSRFWDDVRRSGANFTFLIGPMVDFILAQPPRPDDRDHQLGIVNAVPRTTTAVDFADRFGVKVTTSFGQSECGTVIADWTGQAPPRSVGVPRTGVEVRLIGPDGSDVADGDPGELILRPEDPSVITPGYINDAEATAAVLRGDWYHSGDLLRRDKQGLYYFVDRIKDSIRRRGENISSVEVELAVQTHPEVLDCAAIGVGDAVEQEVLAVVVRTESATLTEAELVTYLLSRLPYYAVPRYVAFMTQLPRTQTGKIQKAALRAMEMNPWDREEAGIKVSRPTRPSASPR